jgi:hypothetical protein
MHQLHSIQHSSSSQHTIINNINPLRVSLRAEAPAASTGMNWLFEPNN